MGAPIGDALRGSMSAEGMEGMEGMTMGGMSAAGWSVGAALVFVGVWTVMMAAMMLPAAAPMILTFASAQARRNHAAAAPTWIFIAGYLFVWSAVGVVVYGLVQVGADSSSYFGSADRAIWGPLVLGVTLVGAGLYQFSDCAQAGNAANPPKMAANAILGNFVWIGNIRRVTACNSRRARGAPRPASAQPRAQDAIRRFAGIRRRRAARVGASAGAASATAIRPLRSTQLRLHRFRAVPWHSAPCGG
jgi:hypothetical protein